MQTILQFNCALPTNLMYIYVRYELANLLGILDATNTYAETKRESLAGIGSIEKKKENNRLRNGTIF